MAERGTGWEAAFRARAAAHWTPERLGTLGKARLTPANAPCLLRAMGVLDAEARLQPNRRRKYRQLDHLLRFLEPALTDLGDGPLQFVDAGCGRSALGYLVAWYFQGRARVLGIDRSPEVLRGCRERAGDLPIDFAVADLAEVDLPALWERTMGDPLALDGLLALHACDTATDHALHLAVTHRARFVAVAPCCQVELARQWTQAPRPMALYDNPHLRRTHAATVTDALRTELLTLVGYRTRTVEFVEAHHTPKNTLIYGHLGESNGDRSRYDALVAHTGGATITLATLLDLAD